MTRAEMIDEAVRRAFDRWHPFMMRDFAHRANTCGPVSWDLEVAREVRDEFRRIAAEQ